MYTKLYFHDMIFYFLKAGVHIEYLYLYYVSQELKLSHLIEITIYHINQKVFFKPCQNLHTTFCLDPYQKTWLITSNVHCWVQIEIQEQIEMRQ